MRTLKGLLALPFLLAGAIVSVFAAPAIVVAVAYFIFGDQSPVFTWTLLFCLLWAYLEWRAVSGKRGHR